MIGARRDEEEALRSMSGQSPGRLVAADAKPAW